MKKTSKQKLNLGIFVIISTIVFVALIYFVGNKQNLFGKTFRISSVFNNVNGLQLGNNVRFSGINVGTVKNIVMINDTTISVDMIVENKILKHLKKNAIATIGSDGLVGSMIINIIPSKGISTPLIPGDTINSYSKISTSNMLTTLNTSTENIALIISDLLKITNNIRDGKGTLGMLINDSIMASSLKQTIINLKETSIGTSKTINELNGIISSVNYDKSLAAVLLSDSISANKVKSVITNLEKSSMDINSLIHNLDGAVFDFRNGKGTLNYMVNDTILVQDIDETMKNIKKGSYLLNDDLEALQHSFLLKGYFKKQEKAKRKEEKKNEELP